jgi:hypothetical protein
MRLRLWIGRPWVLQGGVMTDDQSIRNVALDYIEGWYMADSLRMIRALSPHLAKRRIVSQDEIWHVGQGMDGEGN